MGTGEAVIATRKALSSIMLDTKQAEVLRTFNKSVAVAYAAFLVQVTDAFAPGMIEARVISPDPQTQEDHRSIEVVLIATDQVLLRWGVDISGNTPVVADMVTKVVQDICEAVSLKASS